MKMKSEPHPSGNIFLVFKGLSWQPRTGADNQLFFFCSSSVIPSNGSTTKLARLARLSTENDSEGLDLRS